MTKIVVVCGTYIRGDLAGALAPLLDERCRIVPDDQEGDQQALLIEYPAPYPSADLPYVLPHVKLEAGARSALDPNAKSSLPPLNRRRSR